MKLGIFIPAYNEAKTLGSVIDSIPSAKGFSEQRVFVIDDGSTDGTRDVAKKHGAQVIEVSFHKGLANAFRMGLKACLDWGADSVVHFDADAQYKPSEIDIMLEPILKGKADMVTGDRQVEKLKFMDRSRKFGNLWGSWLLRKFTGLKIRDFSCGFRAYSRKTAAILEIYSQHTYTHESFIQARYKNLRIAEVPLHFSARALKDHSRLTNRILRHIFLCLRDIVKAFFRYGRRKKG